MSSIIVYTRFSNDDLFDGSGSGKSVVVANERGRKRREAEDQYNETVFRVETADES